MLFQLNYKYYSHVFYEKDLNQRLKSKVIEKLSFEIQQLMAYVNKIFKNYKSKLITGESSVGAKH